MTKKFLKVIALISLVLFGLTVVALAITSFNGKNVNNKLVTEVTKEITKLETTSSPSTKTTSPTLSTDRCIIIINGQKYDVTTFRNIHKGGDVFNCGTDMTQVFYSQHGSRTLEKMQKYLVR